MPAAPLPEGVCWGWRTAPLHDPFPSWSNVNIIRTALGRETLDRMLAYTSTTMHTVRSWISVFQIVTLWVPPQLGPIGLLPSLPRLRHSSTPVGVLLGWPRSENAVCQPVNLRSPGPTRRRFVSTQGCIHRVYCASSQLLVRFSGCRICRCPEV